MAVPSKLSASADDGIKRALLLRKLSRYRKTREGVGRLEKLRLRKLIYISYSVIGKDEVDRIKRMIL